MNILKNIEDIKYFAPNVKGVFTLADIKAALNLKHKRTLYMRLNVLEAERILIRFIRGVYLTQDFDPLVLSQTIYPQSYISFLSMYWQSS